MKARDNVNWPPFRVSKAHVSRVSPSLNRLGKCGLCVVYKMEVGLGAYNPSY